MHGKIHRKEVKNPQKSHAWVFFWNCVFFACQHWQDPHPEVKNWCGFENALTSKLRTFLSVVIVCYVSGVALRHKSLKKFCHMAIGCVLRTEVGVDIYTVRYNIQCFSGNLFYKLFSRKYILNTYGQARWKTLFLKDRAGRMEKN